MSDDEQAELYSKRGPDDSSAFIRALIHRAPTPEGPSDAQRA
jgi:hypothetical protein